MKTYQLEAVVEEGGIINLPASMKDLSKHRVKVVLVDLEPTAQPISSVEFLEELAKRYAALDEPDLDVDLIYHERMQTNDRKFMFD